MALRFELIDSVLERTPERLAAVKSVTTAEEYLGDHFPGFPVLPGVMMLETLVQAARLLADETAASPRESTWVLREVRNVRYGQMVRPGQTLEVEVTLRSRDEAGCEFQGKGTVAGQVAVQGRFRLSPVGPS